MNEHKFKPNTSQTERPVQPVVLPEARRAWGPQNFAQNCKAIPWLRLAGRKLSFTYHTPADSHLLRGGRYLYRTNAFCYCFWFI